jgi:hypothetical protein
MTLTLRPPGRGNWTPIILRVEGARACPLLVRVGQRMLLGGQEFRIAKVAA